MRRHALPSLVVAALCCLLSTACGGDDGGGSGSSGGSIGGGVLGVAGLSAAYGHLCSLDSECADAAGTACVRIGYLPGICVKSVAKGSGGSCPAGTVAEHGSWGACVKACGSGGVCPAGSVCQDAGNELPAGTRACAPPVPGGSGGGTGATSSPIGGPCANDGQCAGSARCVAGLPGGYCSMVCTADASVCGAAAACVKTTSTDAFCFARCALPGSQSTCRSGYTCRALEGRTYGVCI